MLSFKNIVFHGKKFFVKLPWYFVNSFCIPVCETFFKGFDLMLQPELLDDQVVVFLYDAVDSVYVNPYGTDFVKGTGSGKILFPFIKVRFLFIFLIRQSYFFRVKEES